MKPCAFFLQVCLRRGMIPPSKGKGDTTMGIMDTLKKLSKADLEKVVAKVSALIK